MSSPAVTKRQIEETQKNFENTIKKPNTGNSFKTVQETDVGITEYVNETYKSGGGFFGTIKQRYSDFQVNEIDLQGNVVHLVDEGIDLGKTKREKRQEQRRADREDLQGKSTEEVQKIKEEKENGEETGKDGVNGDSGENVPKYELSPENKQKLLELITAAELQQIEELFGTGGNMETKTSFSDKSQRTLLHQLIRTAFQGKLETITSAENTFRVALAKKSGPQRRNNNINHVDDSGVVNYGLGPFKNYLHFTVYKENRETMEVASTITKFLRVPNKSVKYAGTKDRRGVTCQRFSIHKGKVARVTSLNKGLKGAILGGFSYEDRSLDLGDLQGNEFTIAIRDVKSLDGEDILSTVDRCFHSLKEKGYINYFGLQRFGTFSISTHVLGIFLLKDDWKGAAELILAEQERVLPESVEARRIWAEKGDAVEASRKMPRKCSAEWSVLTSLAKEKKAEDGYSKQAYFRAIMQIPRNLRLIYVHAYQSYVWNLVASKRIELFGLEVQVGDLVMVEEKSADLKIVTEVVDGQEFAEDVAGSMSDKVRALTEEDIKSGKFTIYDVVLPSPGYDVTYPTNPHLMEVYERLMEKDGLDPHNMGRRIKEFSLAGSYRLLMGKPTELSYQVVKYSEPTDALVRTDLEIIRAKEEGKTLEKVVNEQEGERTAVILKMKLGVSSYATMALREFMKADTSRLGANFDVQIEKKQEEKEKDPKEETKEEDIKKD